jgi:hypothetical protein
MAKSGLKHIDVGAELTKTEWESEESHELIHGTSFPGSPVERQLFYRDDEHKWYIYDGTEWVSLQGGGGMEVHGNEYHDPDFASEAALAAHEADTSTHGAADIADVADIAVDSNLSSAAQDAIAKKHTQGTDTALGAVGTKNPPIDADKALYRDSESSDALKTSTWSQIKAFLKTYFDTLYATLSHTHGQLHDRLHSLTSTSDHSSSATPGKMLKADANGLPVNATNTDTEVSDAVTKKHTQLCEAADFTKLDGIEAGADVTANHAPQAHKTSHQSGGGDAIKLDDLAAPDDNTDLNASTSKHGLLLKLGGGTSNFLRADGAWAAPPGGGGGGTKIEDADQDTKVDVEESADEDKVRMDVAGVEAFLLSTAGELTLPKQSCAYIIADGTAQAIPNLSEETIEFNTEVTDVQNEFNTGTYTFTAAEAGKYFIAAKISWNNLPNGTPSYVALKKNSTYLASFYSVPGAAANVSGVAFGVVELAANDAVHAVCWQSSGGSANLLADTNCQLYISKLA